MSTRKLLGEVRKEGGITIRCLSPVLRSFLSTYVRDWPCHEIYKINEFSRWRLATWNYKIYTWLTIFRDDLAKITKYRKSTIFRDVLANTAKFTISSVTIFRQTLRQICPNSSPFVMLITTHPQRGAARILQFSLTEIAKFTNFAFFYQNFPWICHNFSLFVM